MTIEFNSFMSAVCIFLAITGLMLLLIVPKTDEHRQRLGFAFFSAGMGGTAFFFLLGNPEVLRSAQENIALTLIGMLIATLQIIRLIKKEPTLMNGRPLWKYQTARWINGGNIKLGLT